MQKPKLPSPLSLSFPYIYFIFIIVFITTEGNIDCLFFVLCPLSELKYKLDENKSSVYIDC